MDDRKVKAARYAGFAVNANLKELYPGGSLTAGIQAVSLFAAGNAIGRIMWGALFDRLVIGHCFDPAGHSRR